MNQRYKLSSTFNQYLGLFISGSMIVAATVVFAVTWDRFLLAFILIPLLGIMFYLRVPAVMVDSNSLIVKRVFKEPKVYPVASIINVDRSWNGMGKIDLSNGETVYYLPKQLEIMLNFFSYGEYVMQKINRLNDSKIEH